jgi:hypothetical protein
MPPDPPTGPADRIAAPPAAAFIAFGGSGAADSADMPAPPLGIAPGVMPAAEPRIAPPVMPVAFFARIVLPDADWLLFVVRPFAFLGMWSPSGSQGAERLRGHIPGRRHLSLR